MQNLISGFDKVSTCIIRTPCIRIDDVLHFSFSSMCVYSGVAVVVKGSRVHRKAGPGAGKSRGSILMRNTVSYSARDLKYWEVNEAVPLLLVFLSSQGKNTLPGTVQKQF